MPMYAQTISLTLCFMNTRIRKFMSVGGLMVIAVVLMNLAGCGLSDSGGRQGPVARDRQRGTQEGTTGQGGRNHG